MAAYSQLLKIEDALCRSDRRLARMLTVQAAALTESHGLRERRPEDTGSPPVSAATPDRAVVPLRDLRDIRQPGRPGGQPAVVR